MPTPPSNFRWLTRLPVALTVTRCALAPGIVCLAYLHAPGWAMIACVVAALLSDIYDGILARRLGVQTPALRRFDSIADTIFYAGVLWAIWVLYPDAIRANAFALTLLIALEITRYLFDWIKFRREASYHSLLAKAWGLVLAAAIVALLGFGRRGWLFTAAILWGIAVDLEGLTISLLLPAWAHDVRTIAHAWRLRRSAAPPQAAV